MKNIFSFFVFFSILEFIRYLFAHTVRCTNLVFNIYTMDKNYHCFELLKIVYIFFLSNLHCINPYRTQSIWSLLLSLFFVEFFFSLLHHLLLFLRFFVVICRFYNFWCIMHTGLQFLSCRHIHMNRFVIKQITTSKSSPGKTKYNPAKIQTNEKLYADNTKKKTKKKDKRMTIGERKKKRCEMINTNENNENN